MSAPRLGPLVAGDLADVARLWCAAPAAVGRLGDAFPLGERALRRWWASPDTDQALCLALRQGERLVGALLARAPTRAWAPPDLGHVSLVVVDATLRGRGHGGRMVAAAADALAARGRSRVRLGADPDHLLPGVPVGVDDATWSALLRLGAAPGAVETDVLVDLDALAAETLAAARLDPHGGVRVEAAPERVVEFVGRTFPGRWHDEVRRYAEAGVTLLALREGDDVLGFTAAFRPDDAHLGYGLTWLPALRPGAGALGPLGVDPAARGRGLGLAVVAEGLAWQRAQGARDVVLDWTTLTPFYGRLGGRVWRAYQRAELRPAVAVGAVGRA